MYQSLIRYGLMASVATLEAADIIEKKMLKNDTVTEPPVDTVSIIIPALNEEVFIEKCLSSLRNQSIVHEYPHYFEYILVDNGSSDNTMKIAIPYVDKVLSASRGKLNARNIGTLYSKGNIIVSVDSDITFSYDWLNTLLKPFKDPSVAGVAGSIIDNSISHIPKPLYIIGTLVDHSIIHPYRMMGGNCAYWKHLFYLNGGFNTSINQFNVKQMVQEEEIGFGMKLSKYGKVIYKHNAPGIHLGGERVACRLGLRSKKMCSKYKIGIERFG